MSEDTSGGTALNIPDEYAKLHETSKQRLICKKLHDEMKGVMKLKREQYQDLCLFSVAEDLGERACFVNQTIEELIKLHHKRE